MCVVFVRVAIVSQASEEAMKRLSADEPQPFASQEMCQPCGAVPRPSAGCGRSLQTFYWKNYNIFRECSGASYASKLHYLSVFY